MSRIFSYYTRFNGLRGNVTGLPPWARIALCVAAIPGILMVALSIAAFVVSLLALLLITVPVYQLLRALSGGGMSATEQVQDFVVDADPFRQSAKHVDATVRDSTQQSTDPAKLIE